MSNIEEFSSKVGTAPRPERRSGIEVAAASPPAPEGAGAGQSGGVISDTAAARWSGRENAFFASSYTLDRLPAGVYYTASSPDIGPYLRKHDLRTDNLLVLPDSATSEIVEETRRFWTLKGEFKKRGFLHKRGVLLWGPPGSGKTSTIALLINLMIEQHDGIAIMADHPEVTTACLQMARRVEPERPLIVLLEDIDALVERYSETSFLALLDGESQVDNVVYVATTNYPERLDRRFVDRPSRFDTIQWVGMPNDEARRMYLTAKEPSLTTEEAEEWVRLSDGFSIAHLRELIILARCFGKPVEQAVAQLRHMTQAQPNSARAPDCPSFGIRAGAA